MNNRDEAVMENKPDMPETTEHLLGAPSGYGYEIMGNTAYFGRWRTARNKLYDIWFTMEIGEGFTEQHNLETTMRLGFIQNALKEYADKCFKKAPAERDGVDVEEIRREIMAVRTVYKTDSLRHAEVLADRERIFDALVRQGYLQPQPRVAVVTGNPDSFAEKVKASFLKMYPLKPQSGDDAKAEDRKWREGTMRVNSVLSALSAPVKPETIGQVKGLDEALEWAKYRTIITDWNPDAQKHHFEVLKKAAHLYAAQVKGEGEVLDAWQRVNMHIQKIGGFRGWAQSTEDMEAIRTALASRASVDVEELKKLCREQLSETRMEGAEIDMVINVIRAKFPELVGGRDEKHEFDMEEALNKVEWAKD